MRNGYLPFLVYTEPDIWAPALYFQEVKGTHVMEGPVGLKQQPPAKGRQVSSSPHCRQAHVQWPGTVITSRPLGSFLGDFREDP